MNLSLKNLLLLGLCAELVVLLISYLINPEIGETFRYAARYSGRVSAVVFLAAFYLYASSFPSPVKENTQLRNVLTLFAVLHVIHWGFLATNVYLNDIPLEVPKLGGGALAYLMIVVAPFQLHKVNVKLQWVYFYYVSFVMIMTYVARIKGDFQGAEPFWFHYAMIALFIGAAVLFGWWIRKSAKMATT